MVEKNCADRLHAQIRWNDLSGMGERTHAHTHNVLGGYKMEKK